MQLGSLVTHICYVRDRLGDPVTSVSAPTGTVHRNGIADPNVAVSVIQLADLSYRAQFTIPTTYTLGDNLAVAMRAEHPIGSFLTATDSMGKVLSPDATPFGNVARTLQVINRNSGPILLPVTAFTTTPIIDGADRPSLPVTMSIVPGGYYVAFSTAGVSASSSVHLRVRANTGSGTLIETFRMDREVEELNSTPLILSQQRLRVGNRTRVRVHV